MEEYTFGQELLEWIERDIEKKYKTQNPIFIVNNHPEIVDDKEALIDWVNDVLSFEQEFRG